LGLWGVKRTRQKREDVPGGPLGKSNDSLKKKGRKHVGKGSAIFIGWKVFSLRWG